MILIRVVGFFREAKEEAVVVLKELARLVLVRDSSEEVNQVALEIPKRSVGATDAHTNPLPRGTQLAPVQATEEDTPPALRVVLTNTLWSRLRMMVEEVLTYPKAPSRQIISASSPWVAWKR